MKSNGVRPISANITKNNTIKFNLFSPDLGELETDKKKKSIDSSPTIMNKITIIRIISYLSIWTNIRWDPISLYLLKDIIPEKRKEKIVDDKVRKKRTIV